MRKESKAHAKLHGLLAPTDANIFSNKTCKWSTPRRGVISTCAGALSTSSCLDKYSIINSSLVGDGDRDRGEDAGGGGGSGVSKIYTYI